VRKTTIPTEKDWGDYQSDPDEKYAHDLFAGHTNEEMQPHFRANPIERTSELLLMPEIPFRYYMIGFRDAVMAGAFEHLEAANAASCFLRLILEKLEKEPQHIILVMPQLMEAIDHIAKNQSSLEAHEDIYGNFLEMSARIHASIRPTIKDQTSS